MSTFAELNTETNKVIQVIVAQSKGWCEYHLDGTWVKVNENKNKPSVDWIYHPDKDNFSLEQLYPSWTLNDMCEWVSPVAIPEDANQRDYIWNEDTQSWDEPDPENLTWPEPPKVKIINNVSIKTQLEDTRAQLEGDLQTTRTDLQTTRTDLQTTRTDLQTTRTDLQTTRTDLQTTRTQLEGDLQTTRTDLQTTRTQLEEELQTTRTQLEEELQTTRTQLDQKLQTTRTQLEGDLQAEKTENEITRLKLANAQSRISILEQSLSSILSKLNI